MRCSFQRLTSVAWASLMTAVLVWGCAQSGAAEIVPDADPSLPDVDASWAPLPGTSNEKASDGGKGDAGSTTSDEESTKSPTEAGAPNQGPLPPPPSAVKPAQGEVLITEVMYDPSANEPATEWIEVYNRVATARSLSGLTIVDGGDRKHVIGSGVVIAPGAYVVLARSKAAATAAKVPAAAIVYEYGAGASDGAGVQLANATTGAVYLRDGATTIAQADYGGWFSQSGGSSIQLATATYAASAQSSSWCLSKNAWATGSDKGTPGAASDCP